MYAIPPLNGIGSIGLYFNTIWYHSQHAFGQNR